MRPVAVLPVNSADVRQRLPSVTSESGVTGYGYVVVTECHESSPKTQYQQEKTKFNFAFSARQREQMPR